MIKEPPSPKKKMIVGHTMEMTKNPLHYLPKWHKEFGDVVALSNMGLPTYLISHPGDIQKILHSKDCIKPPHDLKKNKKLLGNGLIVNEGESWIKQRRMMQPAFHMAQIQRLNDVIVNTTIHNLSTWEESVNIFDKMNALTLQVLTKTLIHTNIEGQYSDLTRSLEVVMHHMRSTPPIMELMPTKKNKQYREALQQLDQLIFHIIDERLVSTEEKNDLLSMIILSQVKEDGKVDYTQLRDETMTLLLVGHDSTADSLSWMLHAILTHENVKTRLAEECQTIIGNEKPSFTDLNKLTYLDSVVKECLRLYPPSWIMSRQTTSTIELSGYRIESGSTLLISPWVVHRNEAFYKKADQFIPERWKTGELDENPKYAYLPFGGGRRQCIGKDFAMMEIKLILVLIFQSLDLQLTNPGQMTPTPLTTLRAEREKLFAAVTKK